jgi:hypothetical protein
MATNLKITKPTKKWQNIDWRAASARLRQLQLNIVKAFKDNDRTKVNLAQEQLVRSFAARALAVRAVTQTYWYTWMAALHFCQKGQRAPVVSNRGHPVNSTCVNQRGCSTLRCYT